MTAKKHRKLYFANRIIAGAVVICIILMTCVFLLYTNKAKNEAGKIMNETLETMKMQCISYDDLTDSQETAYQIQLLDKTKELQRCMSEYGGQQDEEFLRKYAEAQRMSGIILMDKNFQYVAAAYLDDETYEDWNTVIQDENVMDVIEYPQKTYLSYIKQSNGSTYDYAVISMPDGQGYILCYACHSEDVEDENQIGMENIIAGYHLLMNGLMIVTDDEQILSSNAEELQGKNISDEPTLAACIDEISSTDIQRTKLDGTKYLTEYMEYKDYDLYIFIPEKEVFKQRSVIMAYLLVVYIIFLVCIVFIKQHEINSSNRMKMRFLRQMSHDIRTPINGIRGMVRIGNDFPDDMEKQKACRRKIWEASELLMDMVDDVLDVGKMESGEIKLEERPFDLHELMEDIVGIMEYQAGAQGITLGISEMKGTHWKLKGSPVHLQKVLINIVSNAIRYNQKNGSVRISCREHEPNDGSGQTYYEFICADTGVGMSKEFQKHMFEQFMQENYVGELAHHGTGLGLTIVDNLVKQMNGTIRCESERGEGTVFYITIPFAIDADTEAESNAAEEAGEKTLNGTSVLLVEDNELNMEIAEFILDKEGINITKAWNGQEAVSIFEKSDPGDIQIILMDIMMPVMNGEEASRAIRALDREDAKTIPIIAMTANVFESDVKSAMQAGMNAHVGKPVDPEQLKNAMIEFL